VQIATGVGGNNAIDLPIVGKCNGKNKMLFFQHARLGGLQALKTNTVASSTR
jgi:hypothetical protein